MQQDHIVGNFNCTAARNGSWTRKFTLTPDKVARIDYATLESVLELKAGRSNIFMEHPAGSGFFLKLATWKAEDGTLQATLLKKFFEDRMLMGTVTMFDIRDALERTPGELATGDSPSIPQKRKAQAEEDESGGAEVASPVRVKQKLEDAGYDVGGLKPSGSGESVVDDETRQRIITKTITLLEAIKKTPSIDILSDPQKSTPIIFPAISSPLSIPRGALIIRNEGHAGVLFRGRNDVARCYDFSSVVFSFLFIIFFLHLHLIFLSSYLIFLISYQRNA